MGPRSNVFTEASFSRESETRKRSSGILEGGFGFQALFSLGDTALQPHDSYFSLTNDR